MIDYYSEEIEHYGHEEDTRLDGNQDGHDSFLQDDYYYDDIECNKFSPSEPVLKNDPIFTQISQRRDAYIHSQPRERFDVIECSSFRGLPDHSGKNSAEVASMRNNFSEYDREQTDRTITPTSDERIYSHIAYPYNANSDIAQGQQFRKTRNAAGMKLRPVSDLPDVYRGIFKFGVFNAVQTTCFEEVISGEKNVVISAPTGSGKTVLFELGIIRMLDRSKRMGNQPKCVYVAPTKVLHSVILSFEPPTNALLRALCSERFQDWVAKFEPIGLKCCELTGDTVVFGRNTWGEAKHSTIIITTCEKWDSLTRNWHEHETILSQIQLFLVDEVHVLNESRGSTLEVVTSRMKFRGSSIRFILVSATVPNIEDVAHWIGSGLGNSEPAHVFKFGDEYRPCQLTRHVVGIPRRNGWNDFQFGKALDSKLFSVLQQFSVGKPILVFCSTRKGVFETAEKLMKDFVECEQKKHSLPWSHPVRVDHLFQDKRLSELASLGIGVHHAGITMDDRRATEHLYMKRILRVLIATSTLAVGVNLPAHMVVIKGVRMFQNNASKEYSDLDVMQMLGRAGRPQFDKDGIAVILCESELEQKYRALAHGNTVLESSLHFNLAEHLNSEIGLGTVTDIDSAKSWLRSSFLFQRMQRNWKYYAIGPDEPDSQSQGVDNVVMESVALLKKTQLVEHAEYGDDVGMLTSTEYGEIMSKYYIRRATMDIILALPGRASLREILEAICEAEEFQDVKLRASEKRIFNVLNSDNEIRFPVKKVEKTRDKVFVLAQAVLAGISLNSPEYKSADSQPHMEAFSVFRHIARISRAVFDVSIVKKDGLQIKNSLELFRCLSSKAWEDRAIVFRQIEQIGEKSIKVLAEHGITSFEKLRKQNPLRIETLLNRRPPFGLDVLGLVAELPQYIVNIKEVELESDGGKTPVQVNLLIRCELVDDKISLAKPKKQRGRFFNMTAILTLTSDMDLIDLRRIPTSALRDGKTFDVKVELSKPSQSVVVIVASETIAGVAKQQVYKPNVPPNEFPTLNTRPLSSVDMDLVGLEDDPDFWNMTLDSSDAIQDEISPIVVNKASEKIVASSGSQTKVALHPHSQKCEPTPRFDGRFECNHPCKDKTKCQHLCCNKGKLVPPLPSKRKAQDPQASGSKTASTVKRLSTASVGTYAKQNKILHKLDEIHGRAQGDGLHMVPGKRLKVEPSPSEKHKRRPYLEHRISFTKFDGQEADIPLVLPEILSDSDDLPETILSAKITPKGNPAGGLEYGVVKEDERENKRRRLRSPLAKQQSKNQLFLESSDSEGSIEISIPVKSITHHGQGSSTMLKAEGPSVVHVAAFKEEQTSPANEKRDTAKAADATVEEDDFAELDAWLQSGSVDIV